MSGIFQTARRLPYRKHLRRLLTLPDLQMIFDRLQRSKEKAIDRRVLKNELRLNGRDFDGNWSCARLFRLVSRMDRGLLDYEKCAYEELLKFCAQRGISASISRGNSKKLTTPVTHVLSKHPHISHFTRRQLISALEKADEDIDLPGFFELLPAELRCRVYKYSFSCAALPTIEPLPPPPIAQASQLARQESLPLFYQFHKLTLYFDPMRQPSARVLGESNRTFLDSLPHLAKFYRRIRLDGGWSLRGSWLDLEVCRRNISLDIQGAGHTITLCDEPESYDQRLDKVIKETDADIRKMIGEIASRVGEDQAIELQREDWVVLEDIFQRAHSRYRLSAGATT